MKTMDEMATAEREKAQANADAWRARSNAVSAIFDMLGRSVRTEEQRDGVMKKLEDYCASGIISADELESYKSTITVTDARARVNVPQAQPAPEGRVKDVLDAVRGKARGGAYDLSAREFADAWEKI